MEFTLLDQKWPTDRQKKILSHSKLEMCTHDVKCWFAENDLMLNADKSEVMMIIKPTQLRLAENIGTVTVAETSLTLSKQP